MYKEVMGKSKFIKNILDNFVTCIKYITVNIHHR